MCGGWPKWDPGQSSTPEELALKAWRPEDVSGSSVLLPSKPRQDRRHHREHDPGHTVLTPGASVPRTKVMPLALEGERRGGIPTNTEGIQRSCVLVWFYGRGRREGALRLTCVPLQLLGLFQIYISGTDKNSTQIVAVCGLKMMSWRRNNTISVTATSPGLHIASIIPIHSTSLHQWPIAAIAPPPDCSRPSRSAQRPDTPLHSVRLRLQLALHGVPEAHQGQQRQREGGRRDAHHLGRPTCGAQPSWRAVVWRAVGPTARVSEDLEVNCRVVTASSSQSERAPSTDDSWFDQPGLWSWLVYNSWHSSRLKPIKPLREWILGPGRPTELRVEAILSFTTRPFVG